MKDERTRRGRGIAIVTNIVALTVACGGSSSGPREARVVVVDSTALSDTVEAPQRQLVLKVESLNGEAMGGIDLMIFPSPGSQISRPEFAPGTGLRGDLIYVTTGGNQSGSTAHVQTLSNGIATVILGNNGVAAQVWLRISTANGGIDDSVLVRVLPGRAVRLGPADTTLYAGSSTQLRVVDRLGSVRPDAVQTISTSLGATASPTGLLTAGPSPARVMTVAQFATPNGTRTDTSWLSIVPRGRVFGIAEAPFGTALRILNLDGSGYLRLGPNQHPTGAAWKPDGTQILFSDFLSYSRQRLHAALAVDSAAFVEFVPFVTGSPLDMWDPEFTLDGQWVFFAGTGPLVADPVRLWRASVATGTATPLPLAAGPKPFTVRVRPSPSPDGQQYAAVTDELNGSIRVFQTATGTFTAWSVHGQRPRWHPSQAKIAFVAQGNGPIFVMNDDGMGVQQLTPDSIVYSESVLGWSPDGAWLLARQIFPGTGGGHLALIGYPSGLTLPITHLNYITDGALASE